MSEVEDILRLRIVVKKIEYPAICEMLLAAPKGLRGKRLLQILNEALAFVDGVKAAKNLNHFDNIDKLSINTTLNPTDLQINEEKSKIVVALEKNDAGLRSRCTSKLGRDMKDFWTPQ